MKKPWNTAIHAACSGSTGTELVLCVDGCSPVSARGESRTEGESLLKLLLETKPKH